MRSTFERVIDGSIATVMTKAIAPLLHPSQTVLNLFREPQSAVQSVQSALDHDAPCACLSLDLSKAFERINPYWILQILSACKAPLWVIMYTRHILLFRRCRHKVQGKLLPSKMIVTGVDMGRSLFSPTFLCSNGPSPYLPQPDPRYAGRTRVCGRHYHGGGHHCWHAMAIRCLASMHPP